MSIEKQTGLTVEEIQPELKESELKESVTPKFEIEQNQREGNIERGEQNLREGNLVPGDVENYPVAQLLRTAHMQMVESEMEKKYLLYHIMRQNLEMKQMKRQIGITSEINGALDSLGLTDMSPRFPTRQTRRCKAVKGMPSSFGRDYTYNNSCDGGFSTENKEAWSIASKLPGFPGTPELGPTNLPWGDAAEKMQQKNLEYIRDAFELGNLHEKWDEDQATAYLCGNMGQGGNAINSPWDENFSQHQKFNGELFKTEICRSWAKFGLCPYGLSCRFAHGRAELRVRPKPHWKYKTEICKKYLAGYCPYGSRCYFVHKSNEVMNIGDRPLGFEMHSEQNIDMTRRWQRKPTPFHPSKTPELM